MTNDEKLRKLLEFVQLKQLCDAAGIGYEIAKSWRIGRANMSEKKKEQLLKTAAEQLKFLYED